MPDYRLEVDADLRQCRYIYRTLGAGIHPMREGRVSHVQGVKAGLDVDNSGGGLQGATRLGFCE